VTKKNELSFENQANLELDDKGGEDIPLIGDNVLRMRAKNQKSFETFIFIFNLGHHHGQKTTSKVYSD
jgi:hypothetical protein